MSRHIQVTHVYVLEVPDGTEQVDIQHGIHIMEGIMKGKAAKMIDLKSSWAWCPREYLPPASDPRTDVPPIPVLDGGITHPWDEDLWIFPDDHPYHKYEARARENYLNPRFDAALKPQLKQHIGELGQGDGDDH